MTYTTLSSRRDHIIMSRFYFLVIVIALSASLPARQPLQQFGQGLGPYAAAVPPNEQTYLTGGELGAFLWDIETGEFLRSFLNHEGRVTAVAYSSDGSRVLTGDSNGGVNLSETSTGNLIHAIPAHNGSVNSVAASPDGLTALSAGSDQVARLWNLETGELIRTFQGASNINVVEFSPDGQLFAMGKETWGTWLWDVNTGALQHNFEGQGTRTTVDLTFSSDGLTLLTGNNFGSGILWDIATGVKIDEYSHTDGFPLTAVGFANLDQDIILGYNYDYGAILLYENRDPNSEIFLAHSAPEAMMIT
ncbi:MAG: hypothetical protein JJU11_06665, partial [Candidatus Sumerlaeia bacterium]|nr:hypothetical protein [Candidatus Sumerlaeia bacterium]